MEKPEIVICLSGGVVQSVYASDPNAEVRVVDWDADLEDSDLPGVVVVKFRGRSAAAYVSQLDCEPLANLAGSDIEQAIEAAEGLPC